MTYWAGFLFGILTIPVIFSVWFLISAAFTIQKTRWGGCPYCEASGFSRGEVETTYRIQTWFRNVRHELIARFSKKHRIEWQAGLESMSEDSIRRRYLEQNAQHKYGVKQ